MEAASKVWNENNLRVEGQFRFLGIDKGVGLDAQLLKRLVEEIDRESSWVSLTGDEPAPLVEVTERPSVETLIVRVTPRYFIHPRQLYAFHKYLQDIAELLMSRDIKNVGMVKFWMTMKTDAVIRWSPAGKVAVNQLLEGNVEAFPSMSVQ